jgi:hypothetical protein
MVLNTGCDWSSDVCSSDLKRLVLAQCALCGILAS